MSIFVENISGNQDPMELFEKIARSPYPFFLDSSQYSQSIGRFSFFGSDPFLIFKSKADRAVIIKDGKEEMIRCEDPFSILRGLFNRFRLDSKRGLPFPCGGVGYFSYDLKDFLEKLPSRATDDLGMPDCAIAFYDLVITHDNLKKKTFITSSGLPETGAKGRKRALRRVKETMSLLKSRPAKVSGKIVRIPAEMRSNFTKEAYMEALQKAKHYIRKGDVYQVNLSQRFETSLAEEPLSVYKRLRAFCGAPFSAYLDTGEAVILSSSPERFLFKKGRYIETRPIKGTRPRGADAAEDAELEKKLLGSTKDRAEHIMIVDLERNDLGRVCEYGSVRPSGTFRLEKYANVFHLVTTVSGRLKKGIDAIDCIRATFPGGSITGAPKIRSMEIIEELEPVKRGVYTGAIGYISFSGGMDLSIAIRTFVVKGRDVYFQVGGGIVADSDPEKEYEETLHKASGLIEALGVTTRKRQDICAN